MEKIVCILDLGIPPNHPYRGWIEEEWAFLTMGRLVGSKFGGWKHSFKTRLGHRLGGGTGSLSRCSNHRVTGWTAWLNRIKHDDSIR